MFPLKYLTPWLMLLALVCQLAAAAPEGEWQWSAPMGKGRAFLWIPSDCKRVRAVVVAQNNMIELGILEHPALRATLAKLGIAEVFIAPIFDTRFDFENGAGELFTGMMKRLADASGYSELDIAPVVPLGHSACASFPWNFAAWNPGRTLAVLSIHGDAPQAKYPGSGRPNPDWGDRNIDGIPGLMAMGEFEWGDDEHGVDRLGSALDFKNRHPRSAIAMLAEPGNGHFNFSDELVEFIARFVRKAADARLPDDAPDAPVQLKSLDPAKGWLVQRWHLNQPRTVQPAPCAAYTGDRRDAFWAFDEETARAIHNYMAGQPGKLPQLLSVTSEGQSLAEGCGEPVTPRFVPGEDGITFRVQSTFMDFVPGDASHNPNAARWAYATAGAKLGHATGGGPIQLHKIVGPAEWVAPNTFELRLNRLNWANPERGSSIWIWASHPGDDTYKAIVQQASITVPPNREGTDQNIVFPEIADQPVSQMTVRLDATSDARAKVYYYVAEGPAVIEGDHLRLTRIAPRAKFPVKVTVVAWQHGLPGKLKTAEPVARTFQLLNQ
ncbi:MAG: hypothetical protein WCJ14_01275 [Verrucomicrobiota bacterium]